MQNIDAKQEALRQSLDMVNRNLDTMYGLRGLLQEVSRSPNQGGVEGLNIIMQYLSQVATNTKSFESVLMKNDSKLHKRYDALIQAKGRAGEGSSTAHASTVTGAAAFIGSGARGTASV